MPAPKPQPELFSSGCCRSRQSLLTTAVVLVLVIIAGVSFRFVASSVRPDSRAVAAGNPAAAQLNLGAEKLIDQPQPTEPRAPIGNSRGAAAVPDALAPAPSSARRTGTGVPGVAPAPAIERLLAPGRFAYHETVRRLAREHAVEFRLVMAIIASESGGDPTAVSPQGAIGLMQLTPDTAARLGVDPWDPEQNIEGAVKYLASLLSSFRSQDLSLIAYNAGPGFARRYRRGEVELGAETRAFLIRVGRLLQPKHAQQ